MTNRAIVVGAAWLEIFVGISLIAVIDIPCRLLFAATAEGVAIPLGRFAGIGLVGLGIACLPPRLSAPPRGGLLGLFAFNVGATIFLAWIAVATTFRGVLLWPAVILHAAIAATLLPQFLTKDSPVK